MPIPREAQDRQLRFQLDSGREHPPLDISSSETGIVDSTSRGIKVRKSRYLESTIPVSDELMSKMNISCYET
eukprot:gene2227-biopygen11363